MSSFPVSYQTTSACLASAKPEQVVQFPSIIGKKAYKWVVFAEAAGEVLMVPGREIGVGGLSFTFRNYSVPSHGMDFIDPALLSQPLLLNTVDRADLHISEHPFSLNGSPWPAPETRVEDFGERWEKYAKTDQRRPDPFYAHPWQLSQDFLSSCHPLGAGIGGVGYVPVCCLKQVDF